MVLLHGRIRHRGSSENDVVIFSYETQPAATGKGGTEHHMSSFLFAVFFALNDADSCGDGRGRGAEEYSRMAG